MTLATSASIRFEIALVLSIDVPSSTQHIRKFVAAEHLEKFNFWR